ncbi:ABC transporter substrate-binding protein, partial [Pannonibacter sp. Pt2]
VDQVNNVAGVRAEFDEKTGSLSIISNDNVYLRTDNAGAATPAPSNLVSVTAANFTAGSQLLKNSGSFNVEDILTLTDGNGYELGSLEVTDKTSVKDLTEFVKRFNGVDASFNTSTGKLTIESDV